MLGCCIIKDFKAHAHCVSLYCVQVYMYMPMYKCDRNRHREASENLFLTKYAR